MSEVTRILNTIKQGDPRATEELLSMVYEEFRLPGYSEDDIKVSRPDNSRRLPLFMTPIFGW